MDKQYIILVFELQSFCKITPFRLAFDLESIKKPSVRQKALIVNELNLN